MQILRIGAIVFGAILVIGILGLGLARLVINGPIGPLAGGQLNGNERPAPSDWSFSNEHFTIAVEVGPNDPHSVTVVCFVLDNELYIPAQSAADKDWTKTAMADGRAKVRIGGDLYPVTLVRVEDPIVFDAAIGAATVKYPQLGERVDEGLPEGVWLFRAERRG